MANPAGANGTLFFTEAGAGDVLFASSAAELLHFPALRGTCRSIRQLYDIDLHHLWGQVHTYFSISSFPSLLLAREIHAIDQTPNLSTMEKFRRVSACFEEKGVDRRALLGSGQLPCYIHDISIE